jgi:AraC-like DNA-binding protein
MVASAGLGRLRSQARPPSRTRLLRAVEGAREGDWELWVREPALPLAGLVAGLWAGAVEMPGARHRTLPNGELMLMFHLGPAQRAVERDGAPCDEPLRLGFLSGLQERPATIESPHAHTRVVAARLWPLGAWALLGGLPLDSLSGRIVDPEAVLGASAALRELHERMCEAADLGGALDLFEAWLLARLGRARAPHAATQHASARLAAVEESRVTALAREAGVSARRLNELFQREVGLPAKRVARILRFRRALGRLAANRTLDLADLALDCGYYDQSHLYRDFRELSGLTPRGYLAALGRGEDGPDVISG